MTGDEERIDGFHAVDEALAAGEALKRIHIPRHRERDPKLAQLISLARGRGIALSFEHERHGQHGRSERWEIYAELPPFEYTAWPKIRQIAREASQVLILAIDHLEDPQNLGAVLRNAEGAGVSAVVMPERRNAGVTAVTRRSSAGATSHLRIGRVPNLVAALQALKDDGCWVTGLSLSPQAQEYDKADYTKKSVLVVGAEGKGLSRLVSERCDALVRIPLRGKVASLNAASAAAVVLFQAAKQQTSKDA
jgi:23S rRNA (guanosine2251-2'-O)-methyltransferase